MNITRVPNQSETFVDYFENYAGHSLGQIMVSNVVESNQEHVYLYETQLGDDRKRLNHIIWIFNDLLESYYRAIPRDYWPRLMERSEVIERANTLLIETYNNALVFYPWYHAAKGMVIEGSKDFGMEQGNLLGIRISVEEVIAMLGSLENGKVHEIYVHQQHLAASFVHELTHLERDDGLRSTVNSEIASHIAQFAFAPKGNEIFNQQLARSLTSIAQDHDSKSGDQPSGRIYDKAQYAALLVIGDKIAHSNREYQALLSSDDDPNKLGALRQMSAYIRDEDWECLKNGLKEIMNTTCENLFRTARDIEREFGVQNSALE